MELDKIISRIVKSAHGLEVLDRIEQVSPGCMRRVADNIHVYVGVLVALDTP